MYKIVFVLFTFFTFVYSEDVDNTNFFNTIVENIQNTANSKLPDEIKLQKIQKYVSKLKLQKQKEAKTKNNNPYSFEAFNFDLMSHRDNFLLLGGYSSSELTEKHWDSNGLRDPSKDYKRDSNEAQFQISLKMPLAMNLFHTTADIYAAYTQNSFWQVYDHKHSRPFRETNYMPELFVEWQPNIDLGWTTLEKTRLSLIHQSNGRDIGYSRSWNRTEATAEFKSGNLHYGFSFWDRWDEDAKLSPSDVDGDDNPDLEDYIGKEKIFINYKFNHYGLSLEHQNDIFQYNIHKGNTIFDITLPTLSDNFNFFIRYFHGYGESLIDYDTKIERISFGVKVHEWK